MVNFKILMSGDSAVTVQFGESIDPIAYAKVKALNVYLKKNAIAGIVETIPTYRSLMVHYSPAVLPYGKLVSMIETAIANMGATEDEAKKVIVIPTCFQGEYAPDLAHVAEYHNTTEEEIIRLFCGQDYLIYMLGFTPGYPYIGGVPEELVTPRLSSPRVKVPTGAVGIGGAQLGIYPLESPGGFQLVGNTPVSLYDPNRTPNPVLLEAGAYVRFVSIGLEEYETIQVQVAAGSYICDVKEG